jgi:hypothetical protein
MPRVLFLVSGFGLALLGSGFTFLCLRLLMLGLCRLALSSSLMHLGRGFRLPCARLKVLSLSCLLQRLPCLLLEATPLFLLLLASSSLRFASSSFFPHLGFSHKVSCSMLIVLRTLPTLRTLC